LQQAVARGCNTALAQLGTARLGADRLKAAADAVGFEQIPTMLTDDANLTGVVSGRLGTLNTPDGPTDPAAIAQTCLGQRDVRMTPLEGALIAATIANNGRQMRPFLIASRRDRTGRQTYQPQPRRPDLPQDTTSSLATLLTGVVADAATAHRAAIPRPWAALVVHQ
jgi:peptidoglycan glycosyltransferase